MNKSLTDYIDLASQRGLSGLEAKAVFSSIMEGKASDAQIAGLLMVMRTRGETVEEIAAAATVMREKCKPVKAPDGAIDIVGTGGDGKGTLNISTAAALVVAGAGVPVAKHGNRNLSSKSGAADALIELGINVMVEPTIVEEAIEKAGIGFMMAPVHHPAMRHVMTARQELGVRTIFNILGPLTNPAAVKRQLSGAFSPDLLHPMAATLDQLGVERAWLVHGRDGTDEMSICGATDVVDLAHGVITETVVRPSDGGLPEHSLADIAGHDPAYNAQALRDLLEGKKSAYRDAVLLNAAASLLVAGSAADLREGVMISQDSLDQGRAKRCADLLVEVTRNPE